MKAIITLETNKRFLRGDVISWGSPCTEESAKACSEALINPEDLESELLYGECISVNGDREKILVHKEFVDVDFRDAYTWNFDTNHFDLKNDSKSVDLILQNAKFYATTRIKNNESKSVKIEKPIDKKLHKDNIEDVRDNNLKQALNKISSIVASAIVDEPTDEEVKAYIKGKKEAKKLAKRQRKAEERIGREQKT